MDVQNVLGFQLLESCIKKKGTNLNQTCLCDSLETARI